MSKFSAAIRRAARSAAQALTATMLVEIFTALATGHPANAIPLACTAAAYVATSFIHALASSLPEVNGDTPNGSKHAAS